MTSIVFLCPRKICYGPPHLNIKVFLDFDLSLSISTFVFVFVSSSSVYVLLFCYMHTRSF